MVFSRYDLATSRYLDFNIMTRGNITIKRVIALDLDTDRAIIKRPGAYTIGGRKLIEVRVEVHKDAIVI